MTTIVSLGNHHVIDIEAYQANLAFVGSKVPYTAVFGNLIAISKEP